jgi:hypothetical protein
MQRIDTRNSTMNNEYGLDTFEYTHVKTAEIISDISIVVASVLPYRILNKKQTQIANKAR